MQLNDVLFWILVALAALAVGRMVLASFQRISPQDAHAKVEKGALLLDVRTAGEFAAGSLPGAKNIPVQSLASRLGELAKDRPAALEELDREIDEIDALVGELLASARLDFSALRLRSLEAHAVATRAIERAGEAADRLFDEAAGAVFQGDASLIARALANLLDNAKKHGGGVRALRVKTRAGRVAFEVEDGGPGCSDEAARRLFQPFSAGGSETSSLGLGLALVRRIAEAHGGTAYAENIGGGGARVGFEVKG